jgi:hypothetical protein
MHGIIPDGVDAGATTAVLRLDLKRGTSFPESGTSFDDFIMHHVPHVLRK